MISIDNAHGQISRLNRILKKSNLCYTLKIGFLSNFNGDKSMIPFTYIDDNSVILEMFKNNLCVSTILLNINKKFAYISSKTHPDHFCKKYNLFLRVVIILTMSHIKIDRKKISVLRSFAINEYSEKCLKKYFNVDVVKNESCVIELKIKNNLEISNKLFFSLINYFIKIENEK